MADNVINTTTITKMEEKKRKEEEEEGRGGREREEGSGGKDGEKPEGKEQEIRGNGDNRQELGGNGRKTEGNEGKPVSVFTQVKTETGGKMQETGGNGGKNGGKTEENGGKPEGGGKPDGGVFSYIKTSANGRNGEKTEGNGRKTVINGDKNGKKTQEIGGNGGKTGESRGIFGRMKAAAQSISVEPLMLLDGLAFSNMHVYMENLQMDRVCTVTCGFTEGVCADLKAHTESSVEVQQRFSVFALYNGIIAAALPLFFILFMGAWSDRYGRKVPLLAVQVGHVLHAAGYLLVSLSPSLPVEVIFLVTLLDTLGGGAVSFLTAANSYIGDVTPEHSRTTRVGLANSIWFLGGPAGTLMGTYIYKSGGYLPLFATSLTLYLLAVAYVALCLPESHGPFANNKLVNALTHKTPVELRDSIAAVYGLPVPKTRTRHGKAQPKISSGLAKSTTSVQGNLTAGIQGIDLFGSAKSTTTGVQANSTTCWARLTTGVGANSTTSVQATDSTGLAKLTTAVRANSTPLQATNLTGWTKSKTAVRATNSTGFANSTTAVRATDLTGWAKLTSSVQAANSTGSDSLRLQAIQNYSNKTQLGITPTLSNFSSCSSISPPPRLSTMVRDFFNPHRILESFKSTLRAREGNTRALIIILIFTSLLRRMTRSPYVFAFTRHELHWHATDYSLWVTYKNLMATTGSLVAVPVLSGRLGLADNKLAMIGASSGIMEYVLYGFVSQERPLFIWMGPVAALLLNSCTIAQRSMMTKFVTTDEIGKVSAVLGALDGMMPMVNSALFTAVYHASVSTFPAAHFFMGAAASALMIVFFCVLVQNDKSGIYDIEAAYSRSQKSSTKAHKSFPVIHKSFVSRTNSLWQAREALTHALAPSASPSAPSAGLPWLRRVLITVKTPLRSLLKPKSSKKCYRSEINSAC